MRFLDNVLSLPQIDLKYLWENKHSYQRIIDKDEIFACLDIYLKSEKPSAIKMLTRSSTLLGYTLSHFEYSTQKPPT